VQVRSLLRSFFYATPPDYASINHKVGVISSGDIEVCVWRQFGVSTGGIGVYQILKTCPYDPHQAKVPNPGRVFYGCGVVGFLCVALLLRTLFQLSFALVYFTLEVHIFLWLRAS